MFIRFLRDYYLNPSKMFPAGAVIDAAKEFADRLIAAGEVCAVPFTFTARETANICLAQWAIPIGIPSSGTVGNNGALSGLTAFSNTFNNPGIYLYFPAGALFAGSLAGYYWTVMSSGSVGTVYQEQYFSGVPKEPATLTPWVTTGPGAYTQTTGTSIEMSVITMPAGVVGQNGSFNGIGVFLVNNSANTKTVGRKVNTAVICTSGLSSTTISTRMLVEHRNRAPFVNRQTQINLSTFGATGNTILNTSTNTGVDVALKWTGNLAVATDHIVLESACESFCYRG